MLKKDIQIATVNAMKAGDSFIAGTLRMLSAAIGTKEKEERYKLAKNNAGFSDQELAEKSELSDEKIIEVISSEVKKRRDAIVLYEKGNRPELAEKEAKEIEVLMKYMPEQLSEEDLKNLVKEAIEKTGAKEIKETGKIMAELMPKVKGKAEGSAISKIIKELLSN